MIKRLTVSELDKKYLAVRSYQATPISADFLKLVVGKPWGNEYLMYHSDQIEIWSLFIGHNRATSMHCHPNKKTAILVLDGIAQFSSLNESVELVSLDTVIIESGVFHSTQAISKNGVRMLEFETPPMKHDLTRLEDKYGRANQGYESVERMFADEGNYPRLAGEDHKINNFCKSCLTVKTISDNMDWAKIINGNGRGSLAVIIGGSVTSPNGDILYSLTYVLMTEETNKNGGNNGDGLIFNNLKVLLVERNK